MKIRCVNDRNRDEITQGKIYEALKIVKDSIGDSYYQIMSDKNKIRHYDVERFEVVNDDTNTP